MNDTLRPPKTKDAKCDENPELLADFVYVTPYDGKTRYVSREHLNSVQNRMAALGYIGRDREPDLLEFKPIERKRAPEAAIDWMAVARAKNDELESVKAQLVECDDRRKRAEGTIAVKDAEIASLKEEIGQIKHLLKLEA